MGMEYGYSRLLEEGVTKVCVDDFPDNGIRRIGGDG